MQNTGVILDGRAGFHVYFLIRALTLLEENGRLAFIMPADTCEGKFEITEGEQEFYQERQFSEPKRCRDCAYKKKQSYNK